MTKFQEEDAKSEPLTSLEEGAEKLGHYARQLFDSNPVVGGTQTLAAAICEKPVKSMLIAAGIGLLIGKILRR